MKYLSICNELRNPTLDIISGVNGDTVDVIFGNVCELVRVETELKGSLEEMNILAPPRTLLPVGSIFNYFAKVRRVVRGVTHGCSMSPRGHKSIHDNLQFSGRQGLVSTYSFSFSGFLYILM